MCTYFRSGVGGNYPQAFVMSGADDLQVRLASIAFKFLLPPSYRCVPHLVIQKV
jgi:hypothetical protein